MREFYKYGEGEFIKPERKTKHSAGYDFYLSKDLVILPKSIEFGKSNTAVRMNDEDVLLIFARSSLSKSGVILANGVGVVDADYSGEIMFPLLNMSDDTVYFKKGDRIAQGVFLNYKTCGEEVTTLRSGGFGSTN